MTQESLTMRPLYGIGDLLYRSDRLPHTAKKVTGIRLGSTLGYRCFRYQFEDGEYIDEWPEKELRLTSRNEVKESKRLAELSWFATKGEVLVMGDSRRECSTGTLVDVVGFARQKNKAIVKSRNARGRRSHLSRDFVMTSDDIHERIDYWTNLLEQYQEEGGLNNRIENMPPDNGEDQ